MGPPGIGKSRMVRESAAVAHHRGVEVFSTYCESHTSEIPFYVVARLLRAGTGLSGLEGGAAACRGFAPRSMTLTPKIWCYWRIC